MRDSCTKFRRALMLEDSAGDLAHASDCLECRRFCDDELRTSALLRAHRPAWEASAALRERVAAALEAERARMQPRRRRRTLVVGAVVLPLAAALALLLLRPEQPSGRERAALTTELIVRDYLEYAGREDKLQHATGSPLALQTWFESDVHLAARVPELADARLLGGRHCNLGGRPAALAFYQVGEETGAPGEPVSLFVFEGRGEDWSSLPEVQALAGRPMRHYGQQGVGVLVWKERGLVYALAGALDADQLRNLVSSGGP